MAVCFRYKTTTVTNLVNLHIFFITKMLAFFSIVHVCSCNSHVVTLRASMTSLREIILGNVDITGSIIKPETRNTINF